MTSKINKSEIPGRPLSFFHALFGRCTDFYGHFLVDVVTSEGSTRISPSSLIIRAEFLKVFKGILHFKKGEVSFNRNENFSIPATAKLTMRDNQKVDESTDKTIYPLEPSIKWGDK